MLDEPDAVPGSQMHLKLMQNVDYNFMTTNKKTSGSHFNVLLLTLLASLWTHMSVADDLAYEEASYHAPRVWKGWAEDDIESITTSFEDQERSTKGLLDGKPGKCTFFKKLEGSVTDIKFKQPREISQLAFVQGGYANWALPKELLITTDQGDQTRVLLQYARGKVQSVPFAHEVKELNIKVESVYRDDGRMAHGGFAGIGEAAIVPAEWIFTETPLQAHQTALTITLTSPADTTAKVTALINRGARGPSADTTYDIIYDHPDLAVRAGTHDYTLDLTALTEALPYGIPPSPEHLDRLLIASTDPDLGLSLEALEPVSPAEPEASWEPLPPIDFPTRQINGEAWREGLSYNTAGRFGNTTYNGLLTEIVGASWFRAYTANGEQLRRRQDFDFYADGQTTDDVGRDDQLWKIRLSRSYDDSEEISVNWTTMRVDMKVGDDTLRYTYGILAPGFLVDSPRPLNFSSRGGGQLPFRSGAPDEDEVRFQNLSAGSEEFPRVGPGAILTSEGLLSEPQQIRDLEEPWFVGIWGLGEGDPLPTFWGDKAVAVLFTSDAEGAIEWTREGLHLPPGRWAVSTAFHGLLNDNWDAALLADRARLLTRLLRNYPVECREYYKVEDDAVRIFNEFSYEPWGRPDWRAPDYAPIPPIYSWGRDSLGWSGIPGGDSVKGLAGGIYTPVGPWRWQEGSTLTYELPRFAAPYAAFPRRPEFEDILTETETEIHEAIRQSEPAITSHHPWIMAYSKSWSHAIIGGSLLDEQTRDELLDFARPIVRRMYEPSSWIPRHERFSGEAYYIQGWRDRYMLPAMFGDPNSNVGQAAYSTYLYAKYSGDWELVEQLWPRMMDTLRIFEVLNDWAVPETTSREAVKYSSIDMDTIAYAGLVALERMAEVLGKTEDLERIAYLRAKVSAATALRFNFARYLDPENKYPALYGAGFAEDGPAIEVASKDSTVGLDHIAMCFSWTGEMPELSGFYFNSLGPDFMRDFQAEFMDNQFSGWRTMRSNSTRTATHIAIRAFLPDWPADKLYDDIDIWLEHSKRDTPPYRTLGMIGAWSGHDTGVSLINWEPARFISSDWIQSKGVLTVELEAENAFALEFAAPGLISSVKLDGVRLSPDSVKTLTAPRASNPAALLHRVLLPHGGDIEIVMNRTNSSEQ
jgi:hypothetical protein